MTILPSTMKTLLLMFSFCLFSLEFTVGDPDPCLEAEHVDIYYEDWRHTTFERVNGSAKCDRYLDELWYRFHTTGNDVMPTSAVAAGYCGTTFPIWANGTLPLSPSEGIVNLTTCVTTYSSLCEYSWSISAKRCQDFYVYRLTYTPGCHMAYCIGVPEDEVQSSSTTSPATQAISTSTASSTASSTSGTDSSTSSTASTTASTASTTASTASTTASTASSTSSTSTTASTPATSTTPSTGSSTPSNTGPATTPGPGLLPDEPVTPAVVLTDPGSDTTWKWAVIVLALLLALTVAVVLVIACYCYRKKTADKDKAAGLRGINDVETVANECYEKDEIAEYDEIKDEPPPYESIGKTMEYEDLQQYAYTSGADPYTKLGNVPAIENQLQTFQGGTPATSGLDRNTHGHVVSNLYI